MADRTSTFQPTVGVSQLPAIHVSTGHARALSGVADTTLRVAGALEQDRTRRAVRDAKKEGALAGASGTPELRDDGSLTGNAFDDSALQSYMNRVELAGRANLTRIQTQHASDPAAYAQAASAYRDSVVDDIAEIAPELAPLYKQQFDTLASAGHADVLSKYTVQRRDEQKAEILTLANQYNKEIDRSAGALFSEDPAQATAWLGAAHGNWANLERIYRQVGPDGLPMFTNEAREKARLEYWDRVYSAGLKSWVDTQPNKVEAFRKLSAGDVRVRVLNVGENGQLTDEVIEVDPGADMTRENRDKVVSYARSQMTAEISALNREDAITKDAVEAAQDETAKEAVERQAAGALTVEWVREHRDDFDVDDYETYLKQARGLGADFDDEVAVLDLEDGLRDGIDIWPKARGYYLDGLITRDALNEYRQRNDTTQAKEGPASNFKRLDAFLGDLSGRNLIFSKLDPVQFELAEINREFHQMWRNFPQSIDPRTGEAIGRPPTYDEGLAFIRTRIQQIPRFKAALPTLLGPENVPSSSVSVMNKDTATIDVDATRAKIAATYGITAETEIKDYPAEAVREMQRLSNYSRVQARMETIMGAGQ